MRHKKNRKKRVILLQATSQPKREVWINFLTTNDRDGKLSSCSRRSHIKHYSVVIILWLTLRVIAWTSLRKCLFINRIRCQSVPSNSFKGAFILAWRCASPDGGGQKLTLFQTVAQRCRPTSTDAQRREYKRLSFLFCQIRPKFRRKSQLCPKNVIKRKNPSLDLCQSMVYTNF